MHVTNSSNFERDAMKHIILNKQIILFEFLGIISLVCVLNTFPYLLILLPCNNHTRMLCSSPQAMERHQVELQQPEGFMVGMMLLVGTDSQSIGNHERLKQGLWTKDKHGCINFNAPLELTYDAYQVIKPTSEFIKTIHWFTITLWVDYYFLNIVSFHLSIHVM